MGCRKDGLCYSAAVLGLVKLLGRDATGLRPYLTLPSHHTDPARPNNARLIGDG